MVGVWGEDIGKMSFLSHPLLTHDIVASTLTFY